MAFTDDIQIPLYKEGMKCGLLLRWLVADGTRVSQGQSLYEVETDDATYEVPSFQAGLLRIVEDEGNSYPVGHVVGIVEYTESERIDHFYAAIGLNHEQRQVLELLRGDVDARRWIEDEFRRFITEKLESSEQADTRSHLGSARTMLTRKRTATRQWWQRRATSLVRFALDLHSPPCHTFDVRRRK